MTTSHHTRRSDGSSYRDGDETAKGWKSRKYYLSDEAIALLVEHCNGTPLTMSAYLDGLIKRELDSPAERFLRNEDIKPEVFKGYENEPGIAEAKRVLAEGRRQLAELAGMPPAATETIERHKDAVAKARGMSPERLKAHQEVFDRQQDRKTKQPAKKDFDLDV